MVTIPSSQLALPTVPPSCPSLSPNPRSPATRLSASGKASANELADLNCRHTVPRAISLPSYLPFRFLVVISSW
ncbi:uncharacterized protein BDZ83DRAFT_607540 [Colletotrichum acutatum]|uniref:Uncharacterized protein n=1 Tax=Glomerella acutata TaxID=27357 RepID=A0AAD8XKA8_GLOAC|nr:uncharacterized protein BDZ83DRAFT_607540 [Colletotrichum acutatum]KAK1728943.1 hypothetical protein BDZ83DRAFT_607540 [Colletotrichum acutatum]